jgi:hypothetical protein
MTNIRIDRKDNAFEVKGRTTSKLELITTNSAVINTNDPNWLYYNARALSKDILKRAIWIDVTKEDVLKNSKEKLIGKLVLANHEKIVEHWVGNVVTTLWDDQGTPQGINAIIKVPKPQSDFSTDFNRDIIKGLEAGIINSFSVGVEWNIKPSHPDLSLTEFFMNQGKEIDNEVVRLVVNDIYDYNELSVVYEGYDANAKVNNRLTLGEHVFGNSETVELNNATEINNYMKEFALSNKKVQLFFNTNKGGNQMNADTKDPAVENDAKKEANLNDEIETKIENKETKNEVKLSNDNDASSTEEIKEKIENLSDDKFDNNNEIKENFHMEKKNNFDVLERQIQELSKQVQAQKEANDELKKKNVNLQTKVTEIEKEKNNLESSLKLTSYSTFKEKALRDGYITKAQLLMEEDGTENLETLYKSFDETQSSLFRQFVFRSALPTMIDELNNKSSVQENDIKEKTDLNKQEWLANYIRDLAKKNNVDLQKVYSTDLYNQYLDQAENAWEESNS